MNEIQSIASIVLIVSGIFFMLVGSVGIIRLPDFFSRTHAVSKSDTLGILLSILGLITYEGLTLSSLKLALVVLFIALANPIGTHALGRAAFRKGVKPVLTGQKSGPALKSTGAPESGGKKPSGVKSGGSK